MGKENKKQKNKKPEIKNTQLFGVKNKSERRKNLMTDGHGRTRHGVDRQTVRTGQDLDTKRWR